jgi:hypothetical protein
LAREFRPCIADGLHARLHHTFLQFRGDEVQALERAGEFLCVIARHA